MSPADKIAAARALIEPLTKLHDAATPGDLSTAEVTDEDEWFGCPHCSGVGEVRADQYINYDGVAANVLFSGVGHEFGANRDWYLAVCRDWPKVRDTFAALADLADAQAQENARLRGLLWYAWHEFNAIRARDGAPRGSDTCCGRLGPTLVSEEWWNTLTEAFADAIGTDARTPWPSPEAKDVGETLKAKT